MGEHNTWEPVENVMNAKEAVQKFHYKHPAAPQQITNLSLFRFCPIRNFTEIPEGKLEGKGQFWQIRVLIFYNQ
jgi:hypothetical protein